MTLTQADAEMILWDRLETIKAVINEYGEDTFSISFSGGKDSTVVHHLVDMALPGNKIPRVFSNTGIEYRHIVDFVKGLAKEDDRFQIITPKRNVKQTLEEYGYPFKSKMYSSHYTVYKNHKEEVWEEFGKIADNPSLLKDFDYIHNLPRGLKLCVTYYFGIREREREIVPSTHGTLKFPNALRYQWKEDHNISDKCCTYMKEKPLHKWQKDNNKPHQILGLMREEGGRRSSAKCKAFKGGKLSFSPLAVMTKEWEDWFIDTYHIQLCDLYYEPYNFRRTGCKGCPFAVELQKNLETMALHFPSERKQCEVIWKPVYDEYRRIGYRLDKEEQTKLL